MKTLLCCIGRRENDYIREFVEYNKVLGFTNICLYDNNYDGEEDFHEVKHATTTADKSKKSSWLQTKYNIKRWVNTDVGMG